MSESMCAPSEWPSVWVPGRVAATLSAAQGRPPQGKPPCTALAIDSASSLTSGFSLMVPRSKAPKGRNEIARGAAPGKRANHRPQALKGRKKSISPLQDFHDAAPEDPGRCPGLSYAAPSGQKTFGRQLVQGHLEPLDPEHH